MKKYLIALSSFIIIAAAATAQAVSAPADTASRQHHRFHERPGYGMHRHHHGGMMNLNLTDAQKQQVKSLNTDYRNQLKDLEKNETITLKDYRVKKAALEQERRSKFRDILTAEQKSAMARAKSERAEKMKMLSQKRLEKMKTDLNLTDEQVSKIREMHNSTMAQAKAIRENSSLTEEQKKEQLMSLRKANKENMNSIFTAEQIKKKEEMRNNRINDMKNKRANKDS